MTCRQCGAELREGARFCSVCGAPVAQQAAAAETSKPAVEPVQQAQEQNGQYRSKAHEPAPFSDSDPVPGADKPKKKRGKTGRRIALALLAALLIGAGVFFRHTIAEFFLYTFSSPEKYYQHVEDRMIDKLAGQVGDYYARILDARSEKAGLKTSMRIEPFLDEIDALKAYSKELSWLEYITLDMISQTDGGAGNLAFNIGANGTELIDLNYCTDGETTAMQVPLISDDYVRLNNGSSSANGGMVMLNLLNADLSASELEGLISRLLKAAVHELDTVEKERDSLEAMDISQRCMVLHVTITPKDKQQIVDAVKDVLLNDKTAKKLIRALADESGVDEQKILDRIEEWEPEIDDEAETGMDVYAGLDGDVVGRALTSDDTTVRYAAPGSLLKRARGIEAEVVRDDEVLFRAEGTLRPSEGQFVVLAQTTSDEPEKMIELEYSDLKVSGDNRSASFKFELGKGVTGFFRVTGIDMDFSLEGVSGSGKFSTDQKTADSSMTLKLNDTKIAEIQLDQERVDAEPIEPVSSTIPMTRWQRSIDPIKLVRTLIPRLQEAGMPDDLLLNIVKALNG